MYELKNYIQKDMENIISINKQRKEKMN